jgi:hypothetical protein
MSPVDLLERDAAAAETGIRLARIDEIQAAAPPSDRRTHARRAARELEWLRLVRLTGGTGFSARLIDLSEGGALVEVDGPLRPGSKLTLEISGKGIDAAVPLEVLRSYVASLQGGSTWYRGACAFEYHIDLPFAPPAPKPPVSSEGFVGADAALTYLLDKCVVGGPSAPSGPDGRITLQRADLLHVLEALHTRGNKDGGDATAGHVVELLGAILPALRGGASRNAVMAALEARLRGWPTPIQQRLQATRIRLASLIDRCMLVEPALAAGAVEDAPAEPPAAITASDSALQKIVVRYSEGDILKGFTQDFHPTRAQFSLWPSLHAKPAERIVVPIARLKAVFFVRDFNGNPEYRERKTFSIKTQGRRVEVTCTDGEVMLGTTLNYRADAQGFFVTPADAGGNNTRVYLIANAVRRVRFI